LKYYRCTRDLVHYRHEGQFYNYRMGQIVPYTPIVQANLLNFEPFGNSYDKSTTIYKKENEDLFDDEAIEDYFKRQPKVLEDYIGKHLDENPDKIKIVEVEKIVEIEKIVEVIVEKIVEVKPTKKKRRTKAQIAEDKLKEEQGE